MLAGELTARFRQLSAPVSAGQREQAGVKQFTSVCPDQRYHHRSNLKLKDLKKLRLVRPLSSSEEIALRPA